MLSLFMMIIIMNILSPVRSNALSSQDQAIIELSTTCSNNDYPRWLRSLPFFFEPTRPARPVQGDSRVDVDIGAAAVLCDYPEAPALVSGVQLELFNFDRVSTGGCSTDFTWVNSGSIVGPDFGSLVKGSDPRPLSGQITISIRNPKVTCVELSFDASVCTVNTLPDIFQYYRCSNDANIRGTATHHTIRIPIAYPTGNVNIASDCSAVSGNWPVYAGTGTTVFMRIQDTSGNIVANNINAQIDSNGNFSQQTYGQMDGRSGGFIAYARVGTDEIPGSVQSLSCPGGGGPGGGGISPALSAQCGGGTISGNGSGFTPNNSVDYQGPGGYHMNINTDSGGGFSLPPNSGLSGNYTISAVDNQTGQSASTTVSCGSLPPFAFTAEPQIFFSNCNPNPWLQIVVVAPGFIVPYEGVNQGQLLRVTIKVDNVTVLDHRRSYGNQAPVIPGPGGNTTPMANDTSSRIVSDDNMRWIYNGARWTYGGDSQNTQLASEYFLNAQQMAAAHTIEVTSTTMVKTVNNLNGNGEPMTASFSESQPYTQSTSYPACQQSQPPQSIQYYVDSADCNGIAGWAADPNDWNKSLIIRIRLVGNSNGRVVNAGPIVANTPSADVGPHRYNWPMESGVKSDSQSYSWTVTVYDTNGTTVLGQTSGNLGPCATVSIGFTCNSSGGLPPRVYGVASAYPNTNNPAVLRIHTYGNGIDYTSTIATDPAGGWWFAIDGTYSGTDWRDWQSHTMDLEVIATGQRLGTIVFTCPGNFNLTLGAQVILTEDSSGNGYIYGAYNNSVSLTNSSQSTPTGYVNVTNTLYLLDTNGVRTNIQTFPQPSSPVLPRLSSSQTSQSYTTNATYINPISNVFGKQLCTEIRVDHVSYNGPPGTQTNCQRIAIKPYVQAYGADIWSGGQFGTYNSVAKTNNCSGSPTNSGYIRLNTNSGTTGGAGTQLAALATNLITGMRSRVNTSGGHDYSLVFANTGANKGSYTSSLRCMFDYYGALDKTNSNTSQRFVSGNVVLDGSTLNNYFNSNQSRTLIASGTVTIRTNIVTNSSFSVGNAPVFVIVARNINIEPSVSRVNAILIAQTDPANAVNTGIIQTCASADYFNQCGASVYKTNANAVNDPSRLIVHGALVARKIYFQRTFGHVTNGWPDSDSRDASSGELNTVHSSEMIDFSPEMYMGKAVLIGLPAAPAQSTGTKYDSFEQLPPIF